MPSSRIFRPAAFLLVGALLGGCSGTGPMDLEEEAENSILRNRTLQQLDRFGIPAVNTVFIPGAMKDAFNAAVPADDVRDFRDVIFDQIQTAYGGNAATAGALADLVTPDIQPVDLSQAISFPNGRNLEDDVVTTVLMILFGANGDLNDDNVDANDVPFSASFPYLAAPHVQ